MSLLADIEGEVRQHGPLCTVAMLIEQMPAPDRVDLEAALANPILPGTAIVRGLRRHNYSLTPEALRHHRKRECRCEPIAP